MSKSSFGTSQAQYDNSTQPEYEQEDTPRAKTAEEVRDEFLSYIKHIAKYWATLPDKSVDERCDGVAFSILNIFDGTTAFLPAFDIVLSPHPEDKEFNISLGEDWYEPGMIINECMLHELYAHKK